MRFTFFVAIVVTGVAVVQEAPRLETQKDKLSYALAMDLGAQFRNASVDVDPAIFDRGLKDALTGGEKLLTEHQAKAAIEEDPRDGTRKISSEEQSGSRPANARN